MFKEVKKMEYILLETKARQNAFPKLFGMEITRHGMPMFSYAEALFFNGMRQFSTGYNGGYFEFLSPIIDKDNNEADLELDG